MPWGAAVFERDSLDGDVPRVVQFDERGFEQRDRDFSAVDGGRRPEVELAGGAIEIIFAGLVEFLENVQEIVAPARRGCRKGRGVGACAPGGGWCPMEATCS